jgi:hypothetical protein
MIVQGATLRGTRVVDATVITQNLLVWLDANDPASYSGTGTTVNDLSGNGYTHTLSSAGIYTVLNGVKCFDCSTTGQVVVNSTGPTLPVTGFTYIGWARMNAGTATWRTLWRTTPADHPLLIEVGTDRLGMFDNNGADFQFSGYNVTGLGDTWVQWAVTGTDTAQTFYINGQPVGTTAYGAGGNAHNTWGSWATGTQPFGYVANMFLYSTILTAEQIQQNYYALRDRFAEPEIVTSNLQLWYDPSSSASYPGTGTTLYNLESAALNGTMSNITYTNPYFAYNGSSSTLSVADAAALEPGSGDWTVEAWVYYSVITGSSRVILGKTDGGNAADWGYGLRTQANGSTFFEVGKGTTSLTSPTYTVTTGQWYQIVGVWTNVASNSIALYVNGVSQGSNSHSFASIKNTTRPLYFGSFDGGATFGQWFNGRMGVARIYNAALTPSEVLQNFNADRGTYGI